MNNKATASLKLRINNKDKWQLMNNNNHYNNKNNNNYYKSVKIRPILYKLKK